MDRKTKWRTFWLGLLVVLSVLTLLPSVVSDDQMPSWLNRWFNKKVQLGTDLQGGYYVTYGIDLDRAVLDKATDLKREVEARVRDSKAQGRVIVLPAIGGVGVAMSEDGWDAAKIRSTFLGELGDDISSVDNCPGQAPEGSKSPLVCVRVSDAFRDSLQRDALERTKEIIKERIDKSGVAQPTVISKEDSIIVELPGLTEADIKRVTDQIERTARLEFRLVQHNQDGEVSVMQKICSKVGGVGGLPHEEAAKTLGITYDNDVWDGKQPGRTFSQCYLKAEDRQQSFTVDDAKTRGCYNKNLSVVDGKVQCTVQGDEVIAGYLRELGASNTDLEIEPIGKGSVVSLGGGQFDIMFEKVKDKKGSYWRSYLLSGIVELSGSSIDKASVQYDQFSRPYVSVDFDRTGTSRFGDMTEKHVGWKMAIILDEAVKSAPVINEAILGGKTQITLGGSNAREAEKEAKDLVTVLRTGSLVVPLDRRSSSQLGATLGADAISKAQFAFLLGSALVVLIMIGIYRVSGAISIVALVLNLLFTMAILATFGAILTLPGIAGLVLTVGMAVDANIIIYERIRDELRLGKSVRGAVDAGFHNAFSAILDSQVTTFISGYLLYAYGSGPIKGFAVTLMIGVVCTLFTAYWCTKLFFDYYIVRRKATFISI